MKFPTSFKAFTLVEMVLYVSICSIFLLSLSTFLSFLLGARVRSQTITEVNQQGFQIMQLMTSTIRNGRSIQVPSIGTSSTTLSLTTGISAVDPTVFTVSSGTVRIKESSNAAIALTNGRVVISSLLFENISSASSTDRVVRITFTIDHKNINGRNEYAYTKTFSESATLRQ